MAPREQLTDFARAWAEELGYELTVQFESLEGLAAIGHPSASRVVLALDERVLQLPTTSQRTVVAHELGHLETRRMLFWAGATAVLLNLAAVLATVVFTTPLVVLVVWLPILPLLAVMFWGLRRSELAADRWAAKHGHRYDQAHVEALRSVGVHESHSRRLTDLWASHPRVAVRLAAASAR